MYPKLPLKAIGITESYASHLKRGSCGVDFGWFSSYGGQLNTIVYAAMDSEVIANTFDGGAGNHVVTKAVVGNNVIINRYLHLKTKSPLKIGQKLKCWDQIGIMGNTGQSFGVHLHFEYWICPKTYTKYSWNDRTKYAADPMKYCYLFDDQVLGPDTIALKVVGTSHQVKRDSAKNQIAVIKTGLNCRKGAGTNQANLGFIDLGIYNYAETKASGSYTWYKITTDKWIAGLSEYVNVYRKEDTITLPADPKDEQIKELQNQINDFKIIIKEKDGQVLALKRQIEELKQDCNSQTDLKEFIAPTYGQFYIYLKTGDKLYKE